MTLSHQEILDALLSMEQEYRDKALKTQILLDREARRPGGSVHSDQAESYRREIELCKRREAALKEAVASLRGGTPDWAARLEGE